MARMQLTDTQYEILTAAAVRGDNEILRGEDATESTLRSLAARNVGNLLTMMVGRRKVVIGLCVTRAGWIIWDREADKRGHNRTSPTPVRTTDTTDPFAVFTNTREHELNNMIDNAFPL